MQWNYFMVWLALNSKKPISISLRILSRKTGLLIIVPIYDPYPFEIPLSSKTDLHAQCKRVVVYPNKLLLGKIIKKVLDNREVRITTL